MKTLTFTKSRGGFMKPILMAGAVVLLGLGANSAALADPSIELVSGSDIVYYDGTNPAVCSINGGATSSSCSTDFGTVIVNNTFGNLTVDVASFNGWTSIEDSAQAYTPSCPGGTCESQNNLDTTNTSAGNDLLSYFGASGFTAPGPLTLVESGTLLAGTSSAMAYGYTGALGLQGSAAPTLSGQIGSTLSVTGNGGGLYSAGPTGGPAPATPYNLTSEFDFTATHNGHYNMTETVSTAVPESSSVSVFLMMLLGMAFLVRKRIAFKRM